MFLGLLNGLVNRFNHTKPVSLINQKCMIKLSLINLHPNEYSHPNELHYYPFAVKLDRSVRSCNNDLSNEVCIPNKIEDLNIRVLNMITKKDKSKILTKDRLCECKCKFDGRRCNSNQKWNNNKCWCEFKKHHICEKDYIWNPATCSRKNDKYLISVINDDLVIICDDIIQ